MNHSKYMQEALLAAQAGIDLGQTPFGACIVINNQIIVKAHNQVWLNQDITAHAEIVAIRAACKKINSINLEEAIIYSTCEPCPMCFSAIHWARIKTVVYGASIADAKFYGFNELEISNEALCRYGGLKINLIAGIDQQAARALFATWKRKQPQTAY